MIANKSIISETKNSLESNRSLYKMNTNVMNQRATELFDRHIKFSQNEAL